MAKELLSPNGCCPIRSRSCREAHWTLTALNYPVQLMCLHLRGQTREYRVVATTSRQMRRGRENAPRPRPSELQGRTGKTGASWLPSTLARPRTDCVHYTSSVNLPRSHSITTFTPRCYTTAVIAEAGPSSSAELSLRRPAAQDELGRQWRTDWKRRQNVSIAPQLSS